MEWNIDKANAQLKKSEVDYPNVLFAGGAGEVFEVFNTQGYGYALVAPDGKVTGTHLRLSEVTASLETLLAEGESNGS